MKDGEAMREGEAMRAGRVADGDDIAMTDGFAGTADGGNAAAAAGNDDAGAVTDGSRLNVAVTDNLGAGDAADAGALANDADTAGVGNDEAATEAVAAEASDGATPQRALLPYIGVPLIVAAYLALKLPGQTPSPDWVGLARAVVLISFGYVAAYGDWKTRKVPNLLVLAMLGVWGAIAVLYILLDFGGAMGFLAASLIGGAVGGGFFLVVYLVSRKGLGGGDVKLMAAMGLFLTFRNLLGMLFFSSMLTALVSAVLLLTKRATMRTAIPFVPFLYAGTLVTIFLSG